MLNLFKTNSRTHQETVRKAYADRLASGEKPTIVRTNAFKNRGYGITRSPKGHFDVYNMGNTVAYFGSYEDVFGGRLYRITSISGTSDFIIRPTRKRK